MADGWKEYQEEVADFFRSLGLDAETEVTIKGIRTDHDIDVIVRSRHVGFETLWLVECKHWKTPVSKLHVLGLREIVNDIGADRGILLSESGFQSGAIEAANLTNVQVTSLAALAIATETDISAMRLRELFDRVESCRDAYWDLDKDYRIEVGLRSEVGEHAYSGVRVIEFCRELLSRASRGLFPVDGRMIGTTVHIPTPPMFVTNQEIIGIVEPLVRELEGKLEAAYAVRERHKPVL